MATEPSQVHYRADRPDAYAAALLALIRHARDSTDDFSFGPLRLADLDRDGLTVTGPDLSGPLLALSTIPGLAPVDS